MLTLGVLAMLQIRHATKAEIMAVLPPSLKAVERPDPAGEKRYARLEGVAKRLSNPVVSAGLARSASVETKRRAVEAARPIFAEAERELTGSLRRPLRPDPMDGFPKASSLKLLSKALALAAAEASGRKDRAACARYTLLGLRLGDRLVATGGGVVDLLVSEAVQAIAEKAALDSDEKGGLGAQGRRRVLALMPPLSGPAPEMGVALRHEFTSAWLPLVINPVHGWEVVFGTSKAFTDSVLPRHPKEAEEIPAGNYDPIATARLMGRVYDEAIRDAGRPLWAQSDVASQLAAAAGKGIPDVDDHDKPEYRTKMNAIPNSIGRQLISFNDFSGYGKSIALRATRRNLARAAILLRHGKRENLPDPFGKGSLKIDAKRRIVYSVGPNGRDDGGEIGKGFRADAPDFGYRY